jgi:hypothetical protein
MNGLNKFLAATFLSTAMLFSGVVQAMQIQQFDKMAQDDRADYVSALIQGAEKVLTTDGRAGDAAKVSKLFTTNAPDGNVSIGMSDFMVDLAKARLADAKRAGQDPSARRLEVEDAMFVTLKKNGIQLPDSFFTIASNFNPKFPPARN